MDGHATGAETHPAPGGGGSVSIIFTTIGAVHRQARIGVHAGSMVQRPAGGAPLTPFVSCEALGSGEPRGSTLHPVDHSPPQAEALDSLVNE